MRIPGQATVDACAVCEAPCPPSASSFGLCPACVGQASLRAGRAGALVAARARALAGDPASGFGPPARTGSSSRFVLLRPLGQGGMGQVFEAWDLDLERHVAIKFLLHPRPEDKDELLREARLAGQISHPHVVPIHDAGEWNGQPYIVMEYVEGIPLSKFKPEVRDLLELLSEAARGVHAAHEHGILHHDIKPANIMVQLVGRPPRRRALVMDFGMAGSLREGRFSGGTPAFFSPEQAANVLGEARPLDRRSDVYALGATLYAVLTRQLPFEAGETLDLCRQIVSQEPRAPRRWNPQLSPEVETIVLTAMERDPARRYPTADALAAELDRFLAASAEQETLRARLAASYVTRAQGAAGDGDGASAALLFAEANAVHPSYLAATNAAYHVARVPALRRILRHPGVTSVAACGPGQRLAVGGEGGARVWDLATGEPVTALLASEERIKSVAVSPDAGVLVAGGGRGHVGWWDVATGRLLHEARLQDTVNGLAISPDGTLLATAGNEGVVTLWDQATGKRLRDFRVEVIVYSVAFTPDGRRLVVGFMAGAFVLDVPSGGVVRLSAYQAPTWSVATSPDGWRAATGTTDGTVQLWDLRTLAPLTGVLLHAQGAAGVTFGAGGHLLVSVGWDETARFRDAGTGQALPFHLRHPGPIQAAAQRQGLLALAGGDEVRVWDVSAVGAESCPLVHESVVERVALHSARQELFAATKDAAVLRWDVRTGARLPAPTPAEVQQVLPPRAPPDATAERSVACAEGAFVVKLPPAPARGQPPPEASALEVASGTRVGSFPFLSGPYGLVRAPIVIPVPRSKRVLVQVSATSLELFDLEEQDWVGAPLEHGEDIHGVRCDSRGLVILTFTHQGVVRPWKASTGEAIGKPMRLPTGRRGGFPTLVELVAGERAVLAASAANAAAVFDVATGESIGEVMRQGGNDVVVTMSAALDERARVLVTSSNDRVVRLWDAVHLFPEREPAALLQRVKRRVGLALGERGDAVPLTVDAFRRLEDVAERPREWPGGEVSREPPLDLEAVLASVDALVQQQLVEGARVLLGWTIERLPDVVALRGARAALALGAGDVPAALEEALGWAKRAPQDPQPQRLLADVHRRVEDHELVERACTRAIDLGLGGDAALWHWRGAARAASKRAGALEDLERALALDPSLRQVLEPQLAALRPRRGGFLGWLLGT